MIRSSAALPGAAPTEATTPALPDEPLRDDPGSVLRQHGWLRRQPPAFARALLDEASARPIEAGATVVAAFDRSPGLLGIAGGSVAVRLTSPGRRPRLCDIRSVGYWCGRSPVLALTPAAVVVEARAPTTLVQVPALALERLVRSDFETARAFADLVREHLETLTRSVEVGYVRAAVVRIAAKLVAMAEADEGRPLSMRQKELAEMANLSRNRVNRVLTDLASAGAIIVGYRRVSVTDTAALRRVAGAGARP